MEDLSLSVRGTDNRQVNSGMSTCKAEREDQAGPNRTVRLTTPWLDDCGILRV